MSLIKIDDKTYEVGEISLKRDAEIIYDPLTQGVMLDFSEIDDAVATKYRYSFTIEPKHGVTDKHTQYDAFYYDITSPKSVRLVELPFGQSNIIFYAKIKTVGDMLRKSNGGISQWAGLTVEFLPVKPQRYASGGYPGGINQPPDILGGRDTRNKNEPPMYYYGLDETGPGYVVELKQCATIGVPAVGSGFCTLTTVMRYHSFANTGNVAQTAYLDDGRIFTRTSVNDTTTWGAWKTMADSDDLANYVPIIHSFGQSYLLRNLASYAFQTITGAIKITLPTGFAAMMNITVKGYDYSRQNAWELILGCAFTPPNVWANTSAILISKDSSIVDRVRFAYDGAKPCIILGNITTLHNYGMVSLDTVQFRLSDGDITKDGWNITSILNETGLTNIIDTPISIPGDDKFTSSDDVSTLIRQYLPSNVIVMWSGSVASIPTGWRLCNGTNGTPDLRDRFIVGAGSTYSPGNTGGINSNTLTGNQIPAHNHGVGTLKGDITGTATLSAGGAHTHGPIEQASGSGTTSGNSSKSGGTPSQGNDLTIPSTGSGHSHTGTITGLTDTITGSTANNSTSGTSVENRPPYYALAYIMKI